MTLRCVTAALLLLLLAFLSLCGGCVRAQTVDTGYRPEVNGFRFQNFGDPEAFAGIDLAPVLGKSFHDEVFRHTGHCFGMASVSVADFLANSSSVDLSLEDAMPRIDRIQTEQSFYYAAEYARFPFGDGSQDNRAEYGKILDRLSSGRPAVIGVYYSGGGHPGHAVVAYRADADEGRALLRVYDPNLPPTLYDYADAPLTAVYDAQNGSFWYDNGQPFDLVRLDDIDASGVADGRALAAGIASLPGVALFILAVLRFPLRPHP